MFELFGPLARPEPSALPLALALLPLAAAAAAFLGGRRARGAAVFVLGGVAFVSVASLAWLATRPADERLLLSHVAVAARVGQLDLVLAVALDPFGAFASAGVALVAARLVLAQRSARRIALLCVLSSAVELVVLADGAATLVLAGGLASLAAASLGRMRSTHFVADRVADAATIFGAAVLFWALGGSWIDGDYVPQLDARVVVATPAPTQPDPPGRRRAPATLSSDALPGSAVLVDGAWLRDGRGRVARAPFAGLPLAAGPHTARVHVGAGSDDFLVPRLEAPAGGDVALVLHGSTTTFRQLQDDLVARDATGATPGRAALARRRFFGSLPAAGLSVALFALALVARLRAFPFAPSVDEPARALAALGGFAILARYPLASLVPTSAVFVAAALAACSALAAAAALRSGRPGSLVAAEVAFAGAGAVGGALPVAAVHAVLAALLLARANQPPSPFAHVALFPTRVAIVASCASLVFGALPAALALTAAWLASCGLGRVQRSSSGLATALGAAAALGSLVLAVDPRTFGAAAVPLADRWLGSSFVGATGAAASPALVVLTAAVVAFGYGAARTRTLERLAASPLVEAMAACAPAFARVGSALGRAVADALSELDAKADAIVRSVLGAARGGGALLATADSTAFVLSTGRLRAPLPTERALRFVLVPVVLALAAVFVVPWVS